MPPDAAGCVPSDEAVLTVLGLVLWFDVDPQRLIDAAARFAARLVASPLGNRLQYGRAGGDTHWRRLPRLHDHGGTWFADTVRTGSGTWCWDAAEHMDDDAPPLLRIVAAEPVLGRKRASSIRLLLPGDTPAAELAALAAWAVEQLPLWWGTAGWLFEPQHDQHPQTIGDATAALAKRYWAVQLLDATTLQHDALRGLPGINWLTLLGPAFALEHGCDLALLAQQAEAAALFQRSGAHGLVLAAGPRPLRGDINLAEDFSAYVRAARLLAPLQLHDPTPLGGPLADPAVLSAWMQRFSAPDHWLAACLERDAPPGDEDDGSA